MRVCKAAHIITGDGHTVLHDAAVVINDSGMIEALCQGELPEQYAILPAHDYGDATILPGLIDMHVHLAYWQTKSDAEIYRKSPELVAYLAADDLKRALKLGVTTIRTVADPPGVPYAIKQGYQKGFIKGPRYLSCNMGITVTGGHGSQVEGMMVEADGPYALRKAVREQIKAGADWIKILASHRGTNCELTQKEMDAAADETHNWNKKCCVHAGTQKAVEYAINAGFDTLEHATFMTLEQARRAKEKGIAWIPTINPYWQGYQLYKELLATGKTVFHEGADIREHYPYFKACAERYRDHFAELAATGIKIAVGTDIVWEQLPITPVGDEIKRMCEFGMEIMTAIQCATKNAAEILDLGDRIGQVKEQMIADLLIVKGDLAHDANCLDDIIEVIKDGETV